MPYMDTHILEQRQRQKEEKHQTLETGIYIDRKLIEFKLVHLFENTLDIMLPSSFIDMPMAVAKVKYPSEQRPQIIKTSLSGRENFTFNLYNTPIEDPKRIREVSEQFQAVLKQINQSVRISEITAPEKNKALLMFSYKSVGIDAQIYNLVCMTSLKGKLLQETFSCLYDFHEQWKTIATEVFLSTKEHFL